MVMEEGQLNQLNSSQTYYIDESHLSNGGNGGYSKVVLAENPEMQPVSGVSPEVVASNVDSTEAGHFVILCTVVYNYSLMDNAPNYLVGYVIQNRTV